MLNGTNRPLCGCNGNTMKDRMRAAAFALQETVLYLDGHPNDREALCYYEKVRGELEDLTDAYEKQYGPVSMYDNDNCRHWQWIDGPWPWESEAN